MSHSGLQGRLTKQMDGAALWVVVGIALLIAAAIIWAFSLNNPAPNVTTTAYRSSLSSPTPFPTTVNGNVVLQYMVDGRTETRPSGAGPACPPLTTSAWAAAGGGGVTFTLAIATLGPAKDGTDTLRLAITVGTSTAPDATVYPFEVHKP